MIHEPEYQTTERQIVSKLRSDQIKVLECNAGGLFTKLEALEDLLESTGASLTSSYASSSPPTKKRKQGASANNKKEKELSKFNKNSHVKQKKKINCKDIDEEFLKI